MASTINPGAAWRDHMTLAIGLLSALLGVAALGSGRFGLDWLTRLDPRWSTMSTETGSCFVLLGLALWASARRQRHAYWDAAGLVLPVCCVSIAALAAARPLLAVDARVEDWLASAPLRGRNDLASPRMSVATAAEFAIASLSLLASRASWHRTAQLLAIAGFAGAALPLVAFSYVDAASSRAMQHGSMAVAASLMFAAVCATLATASSEGALAALVAGDTAGGRVIRRFGLPLLFGTWTLGVATVTLEREGYSAEFSRTVHQVLSSALALGLLAATARSLTRAEDRIRANERRFRALVEASPDAIVITNLDGTVLSSNPETEKLFGCAPSALAGRPIEALLAPASQLDHCRERERRVTAGPDDLVWRQAISCTGRHANGHGMALEVRLARIALPEQVVLLHTLRDMTERDHLTERTLHVRKMEAVGQLAGGIAHDYNNITGVILSYASFLKERVSGNPEAEHDVDEILKAAGRAGLVSRQLLSFSRGHLLQPEVANVADVVLASRAALEATLGDAVRLTIVDAAPAAPARLDRAHFEQILLNLAMNARDAMPGGGAFAIRIEDRRLDADAAREVGELAPGDYVVLVLTDTGVGMSAETCARAFEPFFTTKHRGQAAGLGLPVCYGVVKQLGGSIVVESAPARGTTVRVYLPRHAGAGELVSGTRKIASAAPGTRKILVAEDDPAMRRAAARTLRAAGYTVLEASGLQSGLEIARAEGNRPIHLLLTDVIMPGGSGGELAQRILELDAHVKVLYMSGYAEDDVVRHRVLDEGVVLLQKPFAPGDLVRAVERALDADQELVASRVAR